MTFWGLLFFLLVPPGVLAVVVTEFSLAPPIFVACVLAVVIFSPCRAYGVLAVGALMAFLFAGAAALFAAQVNNLALFAAQGRAFWFAGATDFFLLVVDGVFLLVALMAFFFLSRQWRFGGYCFLSLSQRWRSGGCCG
eukprot:scaffold230413_cov59-Attheya_sp.AAC.3